MEQQFFFTHSGIQATRFGALPGGGVVCGGDYADLYFEYRLSTSLSMDESLVSQPRRGFRLLWRARAFRRKRTGYAYTDNLSPERMMHAAKTAALIASGRPKKPSRRSRKSPRGAFTQSRCFRRRRDLVESSSAGACRCRCPPAMIAH